MWRLIVFLLVLMPVSILAWYVFAPGRSTEPVQTLGRSIEPSHLQSLKPSILPSIEPIPIPSELPVDVKVQEGEKPKPDDSIRIVILPDKDGNYSNETTRFITNGADLLWPGLAQFIADTVPAAEPHRFTEINGNKLCDMPVHFVAPRDMPVQQLQFA